MSKVKLSDGLLVIKKVMDELHSLIADHDLIIEKNTIINVTEAVKQAYESNINEFKTLTSKISFIINYHDVPLEEDEGCYTYSDDRLGYNLIIFSDNNVDKSAQINLSDVLGLIGVDLSKYEYLSKCTFHINTLYRPEQFDLIPSIRYYHDVKIKKD